MIGAVAVGIISSYKGEIMMMMMVVSWIVRQLTKVGTEDFDELNAHWLLLPELDTTIHTGRDDILGLGDTVGDQRERERERWQKKQQQ